MKEKIRPPSHSSFKAADEAELPDVARSEDIGGRTIVDPQALNVSLTPDQAAAMRDTHADPNALELAARMNAPPPPRVPNQREILSALRSTKQALMQTHDPAEHDKLRAAYKRAVAAAREAGLYEGR
jgi:hypothetical protein